MITVKKDHIIMLLCLVISAMLCFGHAFSNMFAVVSGMAMFMIVIIWSSMNTKVVYVLSYFMSWAPILKLEPGMMSLYTVGVIGACILSWFRHGVPTKRYLVPTAVLMALMVLVKLFYGFGIDNSFVLFCIFLVLFPVICMGAQRSYDFRALTMFFAIGIISSSLLAFLLVENTDIAKFVDVYVYREITRYSGFYGDSNFYSSHISAAFAGVLMLLSRSHEKRWQYIVLALLLLYCGLLSASKAYIVALIAVVVLWIFSVAMSTKNVSNKFFFIIAVIAVAAAVLTSSLYSTVLNVISVRFEEVSNFADLTTGRTKIWLNYIKYLFENPAFLFTGKGFSNLLIKGRASHNTLLQMVYQFGLIGCALFGFWLRDTVNFAVGKLRLQRHNFLSFTVVAAGVLVPWMGIDMLFFDEFFLMIFYLCSAVIWLEKENPAPYFDLALHGEPEHEFSDI